MFDEAIELPALDHVCALCSSFVDSGLRSVVGEFAKRRLSVPDMYY